MVISYYNIYIEEHGKTHYLWNLYGRNLTYFWSLQTWLQNKTNFYMIEHESVSTKMKRRERESWRELNHTTDPFKNISIPNEK